MPPPVVGLTSPAASPIASSPGRCQQVNQAYVQSLGGVHDEADIRELVSGVLEDEGYSVRTAADSSSALDAIEDRRPDAKLWRINPGADYGPLARHALAHFSTRDPLIHVEGAIEARAFRQRIDQVFDEIDVLLRRAGRRHAGRSAHRYPGRQWPG